MGYHGFCKLQINRNSCIVGATEFEMRKQFSSEQRIVTATDTQRMIVFEKFTREFGTEVEKRGLSEEQLMADLEETKREVFQERYGKIGCHNR